MVNFALTMERLKVKAWETHYIRYTKLKSILGGAEEGEEEGVAEPPRSMKEVHIAFFDLLETEVDKAESFYQGQIQLCQGLLSSAK
eukprot:CAMPEP_0205829158 /NCGR_PEP_ID=MMETSP0206-20130828/37227_1 /ASSEMBLY_ACC=CAM_ASM_000279 /TAXON_ID=36767 /ORGANISM="Euplotes focardii, Strain TN1" /LENGTH=85 /DNA_ID=CAMNT_0053131615 /DNA_START=47 /DNA_END=301 /DNA_ORIENTATION=-